MLKNKQCMCLIINFFLFQVGDQIIRVNGFPVEDAVHKEVLQLISNHTHLTLKVRSKYNDFTMYFFQIFQNIISFSQNVSEKEMKNANLTIPFDIKRIKTVINLFLLILYSLF